MRIQNEISEVEKREMELRKEHNNLLTPTANGDEAIVTFALNGNGIAAAESSSSPSPPVTPPVVVAIDSKDHFKKNKIIEPSSRPQFVAPTLARAYSTPQLFQASPMKKLNINSQHKGIMQKFIASRGKLNVNQPPQYPTAMQNNFKQNLILVSSTNLIF